MPACDADRPGMKPCWEGPRTEGRTGLRRMVMTLERSLRWASSREMGR